jgi:hypothetical protein
MPGMKTIQAEQLTRAESCIWHSARCLERVRFAHHFRGAQAAPVLSALRAFQNPDGGFGHAIEPDFRGPVSQPLGTDFALRVLRALSSPAPDLLSDSLRYVRSITAADGGVPNVLPNVRDYPRAPWWQPAQDSPGCLLPTAGIVGLLYAAGMNDPWLEKASSFCWQGIEALGERAARSRERLPRLQVAYEARSAVTFLDHVPERARAQRAAEALGQALLKAELIVAKADPSAEAGQPLEFAADPKSLARRWFDDAAIDLQLDGWVDAQAADGGWDVPWMVWTPITGLEWRGIMTLERLLTLRAWGRCPDALSPA